jgi:mannan endo-1,4-beta-mannosidase
MQKKIFLKLLLILAVLGVGGFQDVFAASLPANPNASQKTKEIFNYLYSLPLKTENKIISGQFFGNMDSYNNDVIGLHNQTSIWPGVLATDSHSTCWNCDAKYDWNNPLIIDYWNKGGIVSLIPTFPNPKTMYDPYDSNYSGEQGNAWDTRINFANVLKAGTEENSNYMRQLGIIADGLEQLQRLGISVIYCPFNEMNHGWFWWGGRDSEQFKALWLHDYDYFTNTRGLNNLLWFYAPGNNYGSSSYNDVLRYYPGDEYVDIVGLSYYGNDPVADNDFVNDYIILKTVGKPIAFSGIGPKREYTSPKFDYLKYLPIFKQKMPDIVFFIVWSEEWSLMNNSNGGAFLSDPIIVNRGEIDFESHPDIIPPAVPTGVSVQ